DTQLLRLIYTYIYHMHAPFNIHSHASISAGNGVTLLRRCWVEIEGPRQLETHSDPGTTAESPLLPYMGLRSSEKRRATERSLRRTRAWSCSFSRDVLSRDRRGPKVPRPCGRGEGRPSGSDLSLRQAQTRES
ncbi:unnamed protein product, partial [Ixodes pacificus]